MTGMSFDMLVNFSLNTYVDAIRGKIVISQLYRHVRMQKSGRKCNVGVRKAVSVPSSS